jgi:hypothetical protein
MKTPLLAGAIESGPETFELRAFLFFLKFNQGRPGWAM